MHRKKTQCQFTSQKDYYFYGPFHEKDKKQKFYINSLFNLNSNTDRTPYKHKGSDAEASCWLSEALGCREWQPSHWKILKRKYRGREDCAWGRSCQKVGEWSGQCWHGEDGMGLTTNVAGHCNHLLLGAQPHPWGLELLSGITWHLSWNAGSPGYSATMPWHQEYFYSEWQRSCWYHGCHPSCMNSWITWQGDQWKASALRTRTRLALASENHHSILITPIHGQSFCFYSSWIDLRFPTIPCRPSCPGVTVIKGGTDYDHAGGCLLQSACIVMAQRLPMLIYVIGTVALTFCS